MILQNLRKTVNKDTFQPCIVGDFVLSLELAQDMKALHGEQEVINFIGKSVIEQLKDVKDLPFVL
ncbi:MAG: hypothetical protein WC679_01745 [Bacteroidales bacterium]|jgi:hypothetical protein